MAGRSLRASTRCGWAARSGWRCWRRRCRAHRGPARGRRVGGRSAQWRLPGRRRPLACRDRRGAVLRSERAPETERAPAERGGRLAYGEPDETMTAVNAASPTINGESLWPRLAGLPLVIEA